MESKINQLLKQWPKGTVGTASWLQKHGIYRQLVRRYVASEWLQPLDCGAFLRAGDKVDWLGGLYALQQQLNMSVHVAADTALSLKGLGQYLPFGTKTEIHLFSGQREALPAWFTRHPWDVQIRHHCPRLFNVATSLGFSTLQHGDFSVQASAPERAILEVLHLATTNDSIVHALEIIGGLNTLRPHLLQRLLEECRSVKVKRFFLWAAASVGHEWSKQLVTTHIAIGKGKRQFYRGGEFDGKYQITVPKRTAVSHV